MTVREYGPRGPAGSSGDDQRAGHSSFSSSCKLPARAATALQAVVSLAHIMPMAVVVEGIETSVVEDLVRTTGAGYGQGWLYAAAVPVDQLVAAVETVHVRQRGPAAVNAG